MESNPSSYSQDPKPDGPDTGRFGQGLLLLLVLMALALAVAGYWYWSHALDQAKADTRRELSAIADLKLQEIQNWRRERLADARFFSNARFVAQDVQRLFDEPESLEAQHAVLHWLELLKGGDRYSEVIIVDLQGKTRMALPATAAPPEDLARALDKAAQTRDVVVGDLYLEESTGKILLDLVFPVFQQGDFAAGRQPFAAVVLELDARHFLFPLIQSWPTPSRTAESLLVRREGQEVVFLNDLRHQPGAALRQRVPLAASNLPSAKILRGETRVIDGIDYRGEPVVAAGRLVPETSWAIITKIDRWEVYRPMRQRIAMGVAILGMIMVACTSVAGLVYRQRRSHFLRRELALERERAALAERLKQLMRHANDIILLMSSDGRILEANECALKAYGHTLEELQKKTIHELRTPQAALLADADLERVKDNGGLFFETFHRRRDGSAFPVEVSSRRITVTGQEWILSIVRDTTERKRAEEALQRSEARLKQAVDVGQVGIFEHNHQTGAMDYSPMMRELMSFGPSEGVTFEKFIARVAPEDQKAMAEAIQFSHSPGGSGVLEAEFRLCPPGGPRRWISVRAQTFFAGEGEPKRPVRTIGAVLDITAHKESQARLEQLVKERTARLQQAVEELEHFSYTITHDMRAPLRAMQGFAEMMKETCGSDPQSKIFLERITTSAERMDHLIRDALNYSKVAREELPLDKVDAGALLRGMIDTYPEFQPARATIALEGRIPLVIGNRAGLTQCFSNLLGNAIKFVKPGQRPSVKVWGEQRDGRVRLWIEDEGPGIPEKMIPRLFQMFERGNQGQAGTGVGLALVRKVAERMGGKVGVESEEGRGSRFWVELRSAE